MKEFQVVYIPYNVEERIVEKRIQYTESTKVSCLTDTFKVHFRKKHGTAAAANQQKLAQFTEMLKAQVKEKSGALDADKIATMMAGIQLVDIVALLPPHKKNEWEGVSMYVDDNAVNKGVAVNRRASDLCRACGIPKQIAGDAFVARAIDDNNDLFERKHFLLREMDGDAPWVRKARTLHAAAAAAARTSTAPKIDDACMKEATSLKATGNNAFRDKRFDDARTAYTKAIDCLGDTADPRTKTAASELARVLWLNVSAVEIQTSRWNEAVEAATKSIEFWPKAKAYFRRGVAKEGMGLLNEAIRDYQEGLRLKPNDPTLRTKLKEAQEKLVCES